MEDSLALVRAAAACGTTTIVATPHVTWDMPNDPATTARLVEEVNAAIGHAGIDLTVRAGAEVAITRAAEMTPEELGAYSLGGGPWVLIEPPFSPLTTGLERLLAGVQRHGQEVVIAHPERCPAFHKDPAALARLVDAGVLTSITAGSLTGRFGREVRRFARRLLDDGLVHNVASDAHDSFSRPPGLAEQMEQAGYGALTRWATGDVPSAILAGEPIPARPPLPERRRRWWQISR